MSTSNVKTVEYWLVYGVAGAVGALYVADLDLYKLDFADGTTRDATAAEVLAATQAASIAAINSECSRRILTVWPHEKQASALAGRYGAVKLAEMQAWQTDHVDASNAASNSVLAAVDVAAVDAVQVAWPAAPEPAPVLREIGAERRSAAVRAETAATKTKADEVHAALVRLAQIRDYPNPTPTQVIAAVRDIATYVRHLAVIAVGNRVD